MPDSIRSKRVCIGAWRDRACSLGLAAAATGGMCGTARAATSSILGTFGPGDYVGLALTLGAAAFATVTAVLWVRERASGAKAQAEARATIATLHAEVDRTIGLLTADPQVLLVWKGSDDEPEIVGDPTILHPVAAARRILSFGTWLPAESAARLDDALSALRARGEAFSLALTSVQDRYVEADGRAVGGRAILRLRDVTGATHALADLKAAHQRLIADIEPLRTLIESLPAPIWSRDADGRLAWVNSAYVGAVEAKDAADVIARQAELLDSAARADLSRARSKNEPYAARLPVVVAGHRRVLDVLDLAAHGRSAGIGLDVSEVEVVRAELSHAMEAHRRTLDQLPTAVAIFDVGQRLTFSNSAYQSLWELDPAFLESNPTDAAVLDRLRAGRKLPEQLDFRQWRMQLHEAYRAPESKQHWWHLPDGRTIRVITSPNPEGGITYAFDDVTERLDLERRYDSLIRVQGETLENLAEAVAVFGSDGRLRLHNPVFARMWRLPPSLLAERPHIESVIEGARALYSDATFWSTLRGSVTGLEARDAITGRLERRDGSVVDCTTVPLPDGATLVCFQDVTDTVNVERALRERNDALEAADELKNEFVHHVSYELRTPLTNIIGFAHLLYDAAIGPLTDKQREYLGYISSSSGALLAIINDILDLASIDAGAMQLDLGPVDICKTIDAAAEGIRDRLTEQGLQLEVDAPDDIGSFVADERRIRQILFNLLSNAIAFSQPGGVVTLSAQRSADRIVLSVADRGRGIASDIRDRVFHRFETHPQGSQHRGAGLGLSIVRSFVELHGGSVALQSKEGEGTTVICTFPTDQTAGRAAA